LFQQTFILETDAFGSGKGAVLSGKHPIVYYSN